MIGLVAWRRHLLLVVFVLSGFAGLIYQSIWSHYLGLFLGHAAYAQALVLAIFMGGLGLGAALVARVGTGWRNLIRWYAGIELLIGILGLLFHYLFVGVTDFGYDVVIPILGSSSAVSIFKWVVAAALILPQTILLGTTFPLMSGGVIRRYPGSDGRSLGSLYFTNSAGAALGALASAFFLVPHWGLPGSSVAAGLVNIAVACLAWWVSREPEPPVHCTDGHSPSDEGFGRSLLRMVLLATALSGAASFVYEIVWIRMLSMAVGSTFHAFEIMLASFISGIALGGLWIRGRADRAAEPIKLLGWIQVLMGLAALMSLAFYADAFEWVGWLMQALAHSDSGYALFNLGTALVAVVIMIPAAFFAGTTLPLFTVVLLRQGHGESSIGLVYAWNTIGSILGVFAAIHFLIPALGLKLSLCVGALADMAIGLVLLRRDVKDRRAMQRFAFAGVVAAMAVGIAITRIDFDPMRLASGVFRHGRVQLDDSEKVLFYRDGKTASVSVIGSPNGSTRIATNGKVDAAATTAENLGPQYDEPTMTLLAAVPLALHPDPERVGVIGFGSGMTTHALLGDDRVKRVETIEIEEAMVQGARAFGKRVQRAYDDPRSEVIIDDAKAYFARQGEGFDIIVSEPSNPWISGVGSLFSKEFYEFVPRQLNRGGLFVQWVQLYEIDDRLVASILNALTPSFGDYSAWLANQTDLIIVATADDHLPPADYERVLSGAIGDDLKYLGIERPEQMALRKVADARMLRAFGRLYDVSPNSDFYPTLSMNAPRTRFTNQRAMTMIMLPTLDQPLLEMLGLGAPLQGALDMSTASIFPGELHTAHARQIRDFMLGKGDSNELSLDERASLSQLDELMRECAREGAALENLLARLAQTASATIPYLEQHDLLAMWSRTESQSCRDVNPVVDRAFSLLASMSRRDSEAMRADGLVWLAERKVDEAVEPSVFDEQALLAVMIADAASGNWQDLKVMDERYGVRIKASSLGRMLRPLLLSLADE